MVKMTSAKEHLRHIALLLRDVFEELGDYQCRWGAGNAHGNRFVLIDTDGQEFAFAVAVRERITPQIADDLFARLTAAELPPETTRLVYAPVISERVAEIARRYNISHIDHAGNCRIVNAEVGLFISREGRANTSSDRRQETTVDPFAPKSSRIVRALLHHPNRGWQVSKLANHADVAVSAGLVSKVKQALIAQNYVMLRDRLLYLKEPHQLLQAWGKRYPGAAAQRQYYLRGETEEVESRVAEWCERWEIEYALARFSAAWRLAPEVRYSVAAVYLAPQTWHEEEQESFGDDLGAREVDSGANLLLLTPYDESVFVQRQQSPEQITSALQTWLDLQAMAGRGAEAAEAVFEKHLRASLESAPAMQGER